VFVDLDESGGLDEGEPTAVTDRKGKYKLTTPPGTRDIYMQTPDGRTATNPVNGVHLDVVILPKDKLKDVDFGSQEDQPEEAQLAQSAALFAGSQSSSGGVAGPAVAWRIGTATLNLVGIDSDAPVSAFALGSGFKLAVVD